MSCPLDWTVNACLLPYSVPVGRFTLRALDSRLHFIDADPARRQRVGIELDAHGVLLRSENLHLRDAAHHRDALRHQRLGVFVHSGRAAGWASSPRDTGSADRPGSPSGRMAASACSAAVAARPCAMAACTSCAAASMLRLSVKLHRDAGAAQRAGGGHRVSMPAMVENWRLERRGHRGGHGLGAGAGKRSR